MRTQRSGGIISGLKKGKGTPRGKRKIGIGMEQENGSTNASARSSMTACNKLPKKREEPARTFLPARGEKKHRGKNFQPSWIKENQNNDERKERLF